MLSKNTHDILGSTDQGTSFADIIINNVKAVAEGQISGFQSFLHDPKPLKETIEQRQIMTEMQKQYYEGKLRDEEIIRKYRHDMINHFMVIKYYLNRDKIMCNIFKLAEKCS